MLNDTQLSEKWINSMEETYRNPLFNKYEEGPGAQLNIKLQPGSLAAFKDTTKTLEFKLFLCNVPPDLTEKALKNLCKNYGNVIDIHRPRQHPKIAFVVYATLIEAEMALRSINEIRPMKIRAEFSKEKENNEIEIVANCNDKKLVDNNLQTNHSLYDTLFEQRQIKGPFSYPIALPSCSMKPMLSESDYLENSNLLLIDPDKNFLDEPSTEFKDSWSTNCNKGIKGGRVVYKTDDTLIKRMHDITQESSGYYDYDKNEYTFSSTTHASSIPIIEKGECTLCTRICDKTCKRCQAFYCSLECQRKNWRDHRPECFPMPSLITNIKNDDIVIQSNSNGSSSSGISADETKNYTHFIDNKNYNNENVVKLQNYKNLSSEDSSECDHPNGKNHKDIISPTKKAVKINDIKFNDSTDSTDNISIIDNSVKISTKNQILKNDKCEIIGENVCSSIKPANGSQNDDDADNDDGEDKSTTMTATSMIFQKLAQIKKHKNIVQEIVKPPHVGPPENHSKVILTTVINNNSNFIRPSDSKSNADYLKILNDVIEYAAKAKPLQELPKYGQMVLSEFDSKFYRAFVLKIDGTDITVGYIDFGNKEIKCLKDLRECHPDLLKLKQYTTKVILKDVSNDTGNDLRIAEYLNTILINSSELEIKFDEPFSTKSPIVELIDVKSKQSLNKNIMELSKIRPVKYSDPPIFMDELFTKSVNGTNQKLFILDNSILRTAPFITCIEKSEIQKLIDNNNKIQPYCESVHDRYTPRLKELCLVKYEEDNVWYRAACLEVMGDGRPTVMFVDYGNVNTVKIENIRKMPKEFLFPCPSIGCIIDGIPYDEIAMSKDLVKCLQKHLKTNTEILADNVITVGDDHEKGSTIRCEWLLDILKTNKLID